MRLLLEHGADPNGELVHLSFNGAYLSTCGPEGLAKLDVRCNWTNRFADKMEVITLLGNAGGEMCGAYSEYCNGKEHEHEECYSEYCDGKEHEHEQECSVCSALFQEELGRKSRVARARFETVVALVGIISFWRRAAAAPGSAAAMGAVRRAYKQARTQK